MRLSISVGALGLGLALMGCGPASQAATAPRPVTPAAPAAVTPAAAAGAPAAAAAAGATPAAAQSVGVMTVTPAAGRVGTSVTVQGRGCANPAAPTSVFLFFGNDGEPDLTGTIGAADLGNIAVDRAGQFTSTYVIPASFGSFQGRGGGPVRPGSYDFATEPPGCAVVFTVLPGSGTG
jgi:hypothetical protein